MDAAEQDYRSAPSAFLTGCEGSLECAVFANVRLATLLEYDRESPPEFEDGPF
jgi:hypothetical protein